MKISVTLLLASVMFAQPTPQDSVAALKESLARNQASLHKYTWTETTEIRLKGELKKQEQKQCSYGADGKVIKTPVPGASASPAPQPSSGGGRRGGRLKAVVVEHKVEEMKDYFQ